MTVQLDHVENATVRHDASGIQVTRRGLITGLSGQPAKMARAALEAQGLPRYGDPHPAWPNLKVVDIILTPLDVAQWAVSVQYREPTADERAKQSPIGQVADISWYSTNVTVDVLYDADGNRMFHYYSGRPTTLLVSDGRVRETQLPGSFQVAVKAERADVQIPSIGARVVIPEASDPRSRLSLVGSLNRQYWSGTRPKTWLFGGLSGVFENGRWVNTYELLFRQDTWQLRSDIEFSGAPPSDATLGNGIRFFDVYPTANFGSLGFVL